ncbi:BZIP domain-containing protein [Mycena indigotica]|uniref:BZIP domain-containing protein n=1 Tax=Mycena indigotica TaxID=2126181 RepID=A0A8H6TGF1_9AGAR|nr:BZIP domain-containing protein [Mycena indigotica]KAF7316282.1 BZIP domain-containing protein [Mycena indigotica]
MDSGLGLDTARAIVENERVGASAVGTCFFRIHLAVEVALTPSLAISNTSYHNSTSTQRQDVRSVLNSAASSVLSTAPRSYGHLSAPLESHLSSLPHNYVPIDTDKSRPRTTPVFATREDLAAHYGIPQHFPPAPRPIVHHTQQLPKQQPSSHFDFDTIRKNYIAMLQQKPTDPEPTVSDPQPGPAGADAIQALNELLASPEFQNYDSFDVTSPLFEDSASPSVSPLFEDNGSFDSYLTSPMETPYEEFATSPMEDSPFSDFLKTPILPSADADLLTGPLIEDVGYGDDFSLFGGVSAFPTFEVTTNPKLPPTPELYTLSSPGSDSIDPSSTVFASNPKAPPVAPAAPTPPPASVTTTTTRVRKSKATGTRKNLKPESLLPMDAPTQSRSYALPSATSRKAVPAVFAQKKRLHSAAFATNDDDDEEELEPLLPTATEKEQIEHKRRQNTLAARKSRKRKLEHQRMLEGEITDLNADRDLWKSRALKAQDVLRANGITLNWDDE